MSTRPVNFGSRLIQISRNGDMLTFDVRELATLSLAMRVVAGTLSAGVITVEWSVDGIGYNAFSPAAVSLTASTLTAMNLDVSAVSYVRARVTTVESGVWCELSAGGKGDA